MQAEQSSLTSADWAALPADILHLVFSHVLAPPAAPAAAGLPLLPLVRRWFALASTCKHWRDALGSVPLAVELSAAPAACLAWLAAQPVRRLHIASSPDASLAAAEEQLVLHQGMMIEQAAEAVHDCGINQMMSLPDNDRSRLAYQRERCISRDPQASAMFPWLAAAAGQTVSLDSMMSELEGVMDEGSPTQQAPAKTWSLAAWHSLESLHLEGPNNWHGDLSFFAAASLADLPRLHSLSLACFYGYDLRGLPTSLRRLRLHYEPFLPDQMAFQSMCYSFSLLELPESARLDQLVVEKSEGAVAFEWAPLSRRCRRLMLHGGLGRSAAILSSPRQVLIGVPLPPSEAALWDALHPEAVFVSDGQRIDGRRAATAAWLEDFAHSADCLLSELCLGCRLEDAHDLLQLVPLAPSGPSGGDPGGDTAPLSGGSSGGSSGAGQPRHNSEGNLEGAAKQLHAYHMLAVHRPPSWGEPHTEYFPAVDAAPALREAAATQPFCLICLERSPPELHTLPGLLSLVRQAVADAPPDVN